LYRRRPPPPPSRVVRSIASARARKTARHSRSRRRWPELEFVRF
jgi:hypothetical protein